MANERKMAGKGLRGLIITTPSGDKWSEEREREEIKKDFHPREDKKEQK